MLPNLKNISQIISAICDASCSQQDINHFAKLCLRKDEKGIASFGKQEDFICKRIKIESPLAVFDLKPLTSEQKSVEEKHVFKLKNKNQDEIHIEVKPNEINKTDQISLANVKGAKGGKELKVCI